MTQPSLTPLLTNRRVVLCVGCGGVGKTTVAAALALAAAQSGKRVLCLTIDPARRLANALGFESMEAEAQTVSERRFAANGLKVAGSLTLMMLDTKRTFDELVARYASSEEAKQQILSNRLYQYVSSSLAGTQEYMAMEKLVAVKDDPAYDLIVLDTPPTSNALDFLDAPERLVEAIDSAAMRWFIQAFESSGKFSLNLVAKSVAVVLRGIGKITGGGFLQQVAEFVNGLNDLFGGFRQRAASVSEAFRGDEFGYVIVTTPTSAAIAEAMFFADRLEQQGMAADALVVNRVHRSPTTSVTSDEVAASLAAADLDLGQSGPARVLRAVLDEQQLAALDHETLTTLSQHAEVPSTRIDVPALPSDVHDLGTLAGIASVLCPR